MTAPVATLADPFRLYSPDEVGRDGYPPEWHRLPADHPLLDQADLVLPAGIKDVVRAFAGYRCVRCRHPYRPGAFPRGEWSACDLDCLHAGPCRWRHRNNDDSAFTELVEAQAEIGRLIHANPQVEFHARWRILTVHHLTGEKADCRWWNLAALCQVCHLRVQGRTKMEQVYPFEHSEWFKPYAAGYYASTYLGEELTRDQTIARLDELLRLERAA